MPHASDESVASALLKRARDDPQALGEIHDRYYSAVYRYALYRTGDTALAEDLAAEVFLRLLNALRAGQPVQSLRGWLYGVAAHLVDDHFRRRYRTPEVPLSEGASLSNGMSPGDHVDHELERERLQAALSRLTEEQQHAIALRFGEGLSLRDTAAIMQKTEGAVKLLQFRALAALRRLLAEPA
jgi:RNA polymerase sigma-70 factor (ECF subfamily)